MTLNQEMRRWLALLVMGCAVAACGGRSRQAGEQPAGGGTESGGGTQSGGTESSGGRPGVVEPTAEQACFPVTVLSDAQLRALLLAKLGVELPADAVDASEPDALVRGQQLVDAVDVALEGQSVPAASRDILRTFVGGLVGEGSFSLPAALTDDEQLSLQQQVDRFVEHWAVEQWGSLEWLLTGSPPNLVGPPVEQRAGIMTLGAFLARVPSPPQRAMHLSEQLACVAVPPPPPATVASEWGKEPERPAKAIVAQYYGEYEVVCVSCHTHYIGYAVALDRYDELGNYRESLNGVAIDTSYTLTMPGFEARPGGNDGTLVTFTAPVELGRALSQSNGVPACLARKLNQQLGGFELSDVELACVLDKLEAQQDSLRSLLAILAPRLLVAP